MQTRIRRRQFILGMTAATAATLIAAGQTAHAAACEDAFALPKPKAPETIVDLFELHDRETANLSESTIRWMNREELKRITGETPPSSKTHAQMVDFGRLSTLLEITREHVVISNEASKKYSPKDIDIGYCFGRAMYTHLMLLKMGVQEASIRKVWAIGPMRSPAGDVIWSFHVATAVFTPDGWMTVDPLTFKPEPIRHWLSRFEGQSVDGRMRIYVTEAAKFAPALGKYSRVQLGLDMAREEDWYRHFFPDMLETIRSADLQKLGLGSKLAPNQAPPASNDESVWQTWKRLFGF